MNKKLVISGFVSMIALLFLFGCATKSPKQLPAFSAKQFNASMFQSKVDNFIIVFDASSSMGERCESGFIKFDVAKAIAERMNMTIPELGQTAGLRSFGHAKEVTTNNTELFYGMETYNSSALADKLGMITKPGGTSPLGLAVKAIQKDFEALSGTHNALIIITDGLEMKTSLEEVQTLKDQYGSSLCIYPIQVGNDAQATAFLNKVVKIGGCGFLSNAETLMTDKGMANFVQNVFLGDAVPVKPVTPPAPVAKPEPPPVDSDGDGVYDDMDQCPETPVGAKVNAVGCWVLGHILFDYDKSVIKPVAYPLLDDVVIILKKNPAMRVELKGYTDNIGTEAYNMDLSLRRAKAVAEYLTDKGIMGDRLTTKGFGFKRPVALNSTDFGRSLNRRVEIQPY
ncbi:MAG: cell envelope biogenesis protein OmpA [Desulfobacterales bacterium]|nr:MAG: cell envelope biogenesis protein OmpA [Desulfobacterales bacterium]